MSYIRETVTVAALILPLILLYKFLYGRGGSDDSNDDEINDNNRQTSRTSLVDASSVKSDHVDASSSFPSTDATSNSTNPSGLFPSVEYEVFLSFRGPDTRKQFTDFLYHFLCRYKIHTFRDDNELRKGEEIGSNLIRAIDQSKIYVPVISKTYADSKWCLIELAEIVRRQEQDPRRIILPIFYMVDPSEVRHQTGCYKKAFQEHANKFDEKTIQSWKDALKKVGVLKGWHIGSNDEQGARAEEVSTEVWSHLSKENLILETDELVGIDDTIEVVEEKLSLHSKRVTMVGLYGMGGIGKTTIAKAVYNKISSQFDRCCFVENIRETQGQKKDGNIVVLQEKILTEILGTKSFGLANDSAGRRMIKDRLSRLKTLIVFDDVDEKFKFENIYGSPEEFNFGSRFIITSRNRNVLSTLIENQCELHEVGSLSPPHSLELFCKHAFRKNSPLPGYKSLADDIVKITGGLPLTLKVTGSLLFRQERAFWNDKLEQLRESLRVDEVHDRLKISYDALEHEARQIFLDIACFFIGTNKEMPSYMWNDCKFYPASNIIILIQRCMIKVGDKDEFQMHDQLRDMGREIVRREDVERPWMRSRIWSTEEATELLLNKKGSSQVKAIRFSSPWTVKYELKSEYFSNLSELRYFHAESVIFTGDFNNLLPNLRWFELDKYDHRDPQPKLRWFELDTHQHREKDPPNLANFIPKKLVIFDLTYSDVTDAWGVLSHIKMAERLKVVKFYNCWCCKRLPYFPRNMEVLSIRSMNQVDKNQIEELDIGELKKLKSLVLEEMNIQKISGGTFGMLKELEELRFGELFKCANLREVVSDLGQLSSLKILNTGKHASLSRDYREEMQSDRWAIHYEFPICLKELTTTSRISNLTKMLDLEVLDVDRCKDGIDIPHASNSDEGQGSVWWKVSKLKSMKLYGTKFNINDASDGGRYLLPSSLTSLRFRGCYEPTWLPGLENLDKLTLLELVHISQTLGADLDGLQGLASLQTLEIWSVRGLARIKGLRDLLCSSTRCKLRSLVVHFCRDLTELLPCELDDQTVVTPSLQRLRIDDCPKLEVGPMIRSLRKFPMLKELMLVGVNITKEEDLEVLGSLEELVLLELGTSASLERLPCLSKLQKLSNLQVCMPRLREIQGLAELKSLQVLVLGGCTSLERLCPEDHQQHFFSSLENLNFLDIRMCKNLSEDHLSALKATLPPNLSMIWPQEDNWKRAAHLRKRELEYWRSNTRPVV